MRADAGVCAVITDRYATVNELMAPYYRYCDIETYEDEYESSTLRFTFDPTDESGPILYPYWNDEPEGCVTSDIPVSMIYDTFERYMGQMHPDIKECYGSCENPNARWSWYRELESPCPYDEFLGRVPIRLCDLDDRHLFITCSRTYPLFDSFLTPDGEWRDLHAKAHPIWACFGFQRDLENELRSRRSDGVVHVVEYHIDLGE